MINVKWIFFSFIVFFSSSCFSKNLSVVLMYHQIAHLKNDMNTTPELFSEQMKYLHDNNYNVVSALSLVDAIKKREYLPPKSVIITFDDGWSNQKVAMAILNKYNYPAMFALITEYQTFRNKTYLSRQDVAENEGGNFIFVNHSHTHFMKDFLVNPNSDVAISKKQMEQTTKEFIPIYVYPYGKKNHGLLEALKKNGYEAGFGVYSHPVDVKNSNIFNIDRYLMNDTVDLEKFKKIVEQTI